jgi:hypothetical protein
MISVYIIIHSLDMNVIMNYAPYDEIVPCYGSQDELGLSVVVWVFRIFIAPPWIFEYHLWKAIFVNHFQNFFSKFVSIFLFFSTICVTSNLSLMSEFLRRFNLMKYNHVLKRRVWTTCYFWD